MACKFNTKSTMGLLLAILCLGTTAVAGLKCDPKPVQLFANFREQSIFSPGYPQNYETDDECTWRIMASVPGTDFAIQIVTMDIDLNDPNKDCKTDYLAAFKGDGADGQMIARWCGQDKRVIKSTDKSVTIKFHSDGQYTGRGFVLQFSLVNVATVECREGQKNKVTVRDVPVYESFQGKASVQRCEWHISTDTPNSLLVLEMFKPSDIACNEGEFDFYDGVNTDSHVAFQYCSTTKPFSVMYMSSSAAVLTFERKSRITKDPDNVILKISTRMPDYDCTVSSLPTLEVRQGPAIFSLPFAKNPRGTPCPVRVWTPEKDSSLRLDVMGTSEREATCDMEVVTVSGPKSGNLPMMCPSGDHPVYFQTRDTSAEVAATTQSSVSVFMRASVVSRTCNGVPKTRIARKDVIVKEHWPSEDGYEDLAYCNYLISVDHFEERVSATIAWRLPTQELHPYTNTGSCGGDYINVYDGSSSAAPLLYSSCRRQDRPYSVVNTTLVSSRGQMFLVFLANARVTGEPVSIEYHAIAGGQQCPEGPQEIAVNGTAITLMSPNYPGVFPMKQMCVYQLTANLSDEVIVVKVVDANLDQHCKTHLTVYSGEYQPGIADNIEGTVCGQNTPTFRIANNTVSLVAFSDDETGPGGWKIEVYTEEDSGNSAPNLANLSFLTLLLTLAISYLS